MADEEDVNEKILLQEMLLKNQAGLSHFIDKYGRYIYAIIKRIALEYASPEDMEEAVSDVLLKIWRGADKIDLQKGSLKTYVRTVARNQAIDLLKACKKSDMFISLDEDIIFIDGSPLEVLCKDEEKQEVTNAVLSFGEPDKEIFLRRYYLGDELKKIAGHLNISERAVEGRLYRGRQKLREILEGGQFL